MIVESRAQTDNRCNGHGVILRVADRGSTAVPGCRAPLNKPYSRGKRLLLMERVQTYRGHLKGFAGAKESVTDGLNISLGDAIEV